MAVVALLALVMVGPASAEENIDAGKTPAQLFSQNCAICHKSPSGMAKAGGLFGLENFLRVHYTASRETAAAIARYLVALDRKQPARARHAPRHERVKAGTKPGKLPPRKPNATAKSESKSEAKSDSKDKAKSDAQSESKAKPESKPESKPIESDGAKPAGEPAGVKAENKAGKLPDKKAD